MAAFLVAVFIWEYSRVFRNATFVPLYNLTATLLDCM